MQGLFGLYVQKKFSPSIKRIKKTHLVAQNEKQKNRLFRRCDIIIIIIVACFQTPYHTSSFITLLLLHHNQYRDAFFNNEEEVVA